IQTMTIAFSIYILFQYQLSKKLLVALLVGGGILGYPLYLWHSTIGIFFLLLYWVVIIVIFQKRIFTGIVFPVIAIINSVISDYISFVTFSSILNIAVDRSQSSIEVSAVIITSCIVTLLLSFVLSFLFSNFFKQDSFMRSYGTVFATLSIVTLVIFYINILIGKQSGFSDENIRANSILFIFYFAILIGVCILLTKMIVKE